MSMPYGFKYAFPTFVRATTKTFHNDVCDIIEVYVDDKVVKTRQLLGSSTQGTEGRQLWPILVTRLRTRRGSRQSRAGASNIM
jgi:hypothetical protein